MNQQLTALPAEPTAHRWTREEFYRALETGVLADRRHELIEGEVVDMPAQKNFHGSVVTLVLDALRIVFGKGYWVRPQLSLDLSPLSVVDPDLAVIVGDAKTCAADNPTTALLVVEVSEKLTYDRTTKASLYARSGIADYWIVNLVDCQLEVYRTPVAEKSQPFGFEYADRQILDPEDEVSPLALPAVKIKVADLIPDGLLPKP
jgi:Uma2 family endonuclease